MYRVHIISVFILCLPNFIEFPISTLSVLLCRGRKNRDAKFANKYNYHPFFLYFIDNSIIKNSVFYILWIDKIWMCDYNKKRVRARRCVDGTHKK